MKLPAALDRRFRLIAFDWDGTAVASRADQAAPLGRPLERLLRCGVTAVVITGTNFENIHRQLSPAVRPRAKRSLYLATNRGSEVYGFDQALRPVLLSKRVATAAEEKLLTEIAEAVRQELAQRPGLEVRVISNRMNRRKIDLIPLDQWSDPPKAALGDLLLAVETRLKGAGISGGLCEVVALAHRVALASGLTAPRITTDVKHVEIGLTDKADAVDWILRELLPPRALCPADLLVAGDEFGNVAGVPGSDSRMLTPGSEGATFVSVGPEPGGVPPQVLHLGGGPGRFQELLEAQAALYPVELAATPERRPAWLMVEEGFTVTREHELESLFAIGNGLVGSRGSLAEGSALSAPATFLAGAFDAGAGSGPELVRAPDWTTLSISAGGEALRLDTGENLEHRRVLDLRQAIVWREWRHRDEAGRLTRIRGFRLASQAQRHLLLQSVLLTPENYSGEVTFEAAALARTLAMHTSSGLRLELAVASEIEGPTGRREAPALLSSPAPEEKERWSIEVEVGKSYRLDRLVAVALTGGSRPEEEARARLTRAAAEGVESVVEAHCAAWRARWGDSDVVIEGDEAAQRAVRFALYHLLSAVNPDDDRASIGARALTGPAYRGHVFWDTEIYMLPFFTLTYPAAARALLGYRYRTLPAARARAARLGCRGALYAWESAETGEDVTPKFVLAPDGEVIHIRMGEEEQHISADVAYGVWSYWEATGDVAFLLEAGAEVLLETGRFWASRAQQEEDGRYHLRGVTGPDEYHESVDDDAYTNGMAQWNLEVAAEVAALVARRWPERWRELAARLQLGADEPDQWLEVARALYTGLDPATGLIEQFRGYFALEEIDLAAYEPRTVPLDVLLGRERVRRSKIVKQPDVVMLLYLLWNRFPAGLREANFRYYEPRTGHGSSLSPPIHAAVAARLGQTGLALEYFRQTAEIDLANKMGNAAGGVHAAALGGLWQAIVFGFAGLELAPGGPRARPRLPPGWQALRFAIQWQGRRFAFHPPEEAPRAEALPELRP